MRRIWEPCSFVGQQGVCTVCFPTFYIFMYPHLQIAVSVDADLTEHVLAPHPLLFAINELRRVYGEGIEYCPDTTVDSER